MRALARLAPLIAAFAVSASAQEPDWLQEARAREGKLGRSRKVAAPDGAFEARIPVKLAEPITKDEDGDYSVNLDVGAESPVECFVSKDSLDPPYFLSKVSETTFQFLAEQHGPIEAKAVEQVDAGAMGGAPFMALDWLYRAKTEKGAQLGAANLVYALKGDSSIYCGHFELGYTKTRRGAVGAFVESLTFEGAPPRPEFVEIAVMRVGGQRVGVGISQLSRDDEGDAKFEQTVHMLVPSTSDALSAHSEYELQWIAKSDDSLINAAAVETEGGEVEADLQLRWSGEKERWTVAGTFKGKKLSAELPEGGGPASWLAQAKSLRAALAADGASGRTLTWLDWTSGSPTTLLETKTTILELLDAKRGKVKQTVGGVSVEAVVERSSGLTLTAEGSVGPASLSIERVYVDGEI